MNYIIVDLEATCWEKDADKRNEIIEIGAVKIDEDQKIIGEFEQFVKPVCFPFLSDFCTQLTSIRQEDVDNAPLFYDAVNTFRDWIGEEEFYLCSWGFYDKKQFEEDCELHHLDSSWTRNHISLKHQHAKITKQRRPLGMKNALLKEGFALDGTHHRGIDDARNIAKLFLRYFNDWQYVQD